MFAVIFICGNVFLRIAGKIAKIAKIRTRKNFVPHGKTQSVGFRLHLYNQRYFSSPWPAKIYNCAKNKQTNKPKQAMNYRQFLCLFQITVKPRFWDTPFIRILFLPSSFYSPFSVVRPTQIFGIFKKKKGTTQLNHFSLEIILLI